MRVLGLGADGGACWHYRIKGPLEAVGEANLAAVHIGTTKTRVGDDDRTKAVAACGTIAQAYHFIREADSLPDVADFDVVVLQRPSMAKAERVVERALAHGVKIIVDDDDNFVNVPRTSPMYKDWGTDGQLVLDWFRRLGQPLPPEMREATPAGARAYTREMLKVHLDVVHVADALTVTTPHLAHLYRHHNKHIYVLPNQMVEADWQGIAPIPPEGELWLGWAGSWGHLDDLRMIEDAIARVLGMLPHVKFVVAGFPVVLNHLKRIPRERCIAFEWAPMDEYRRYTASMDVILAPAVDCPFNRGKSDIRVLEAWMCGRPVVASPTTYGATVRAADGGVVAKDTKGWINAMSRLLADDGLRRELGFGGRHYAMTQRTYTVNAWRWAAAYREVLGVNLRLSNEVHQSTP